MAGVKQFDPDVALERIMRVFWRRGFDGTSIDDLVRATGLKRGSLYNAFGDKEAMFEQAIARYEESVAKPILEALDQPDPQAGLIGYLEAHVARMDEPEAPRGCFATGVCFGAVEDDPELAARTSAQVERLERLLSDALRRWQQQGQLDPDLDPHAAALFLFALTRGLAVLHRAGGDAAAVRAALEAARPMIACWCRDDAPTSAPDLQSGADGSHSSRS